MSHVIWSTYPFLLMFMITTSLLESVVAPVTDRNHSANTILTRPRSSVGLIKAAKMRLCISRSTTHLGAFDFPTNLKTCGGCGCVKSWQLHDLVSTFIRKQFAQEMCPGEVQVSLECVESKHRKQGSLGIGAGRFLDIL